MVSRNMNIKCTFGDSLHINDRHVFGHWRRCHFDIQWQSIELCSIIGKKVELVNNALGYLVKEIYNQSVVLAKRESSSTQSTRERIKNARMQKLYSIPDLNHWMVFAVNTASGKSTEKSRKSRSS